MHAQDTTSPRRFPARCLGCGTVFDQNGPGVPHKDSDFENFFCSAKCALAVPDSILDRAHWPSIDRDLRICETPASHNCICLCVTCGLLFTLPEKKVSKGKGKYCTKWCRDYTPIKLSGRSY